MLINQSLQYHILCHQWVYTRAHDVIFIVEGQGRACNFLFGGGEKCDINSTHKLEAILRDVCTAVSLPGK